MEFRELPGDDDGAVVGKGFFERGQVAVDPSSPRAESAARIRPAGASNSPASVAKSNVMERRMVPSWLEVGVIGTALTCSPIGISTAQTPSTELEWTREPRSFSPAKLLRAVPTIRRIEPFRYRVTGMGSRGRRPCPGMVVGW